MFSRCKIRLLEQRVLLSEDEAAYFSLGGRWLHSSSLANFEAAAHFLWTNLEKVFAYIEESLKTVNECSSGIKEAPLH